MSELGEGAAVSTVTESGLTGSVKVSVRNIHTAKRIEGAVVTLNGKSKESSSSEDLVFSDVPVGAVSLKVSKHYQEADYLTFIFHKIPFSKKSITKSWEAKVAHKEAVLVVENKETKQRIEIPAFRLEEGVRFCRKDLKIKGEDGIDYGHWWVEIGDKSYGWWPVEGELSGKDLPEPTPPDPLPADASITDKISYISKKAGYQASLARYKANYSMVGQYGQAIGKTFWGVEGILNGSEDLRRQEQDPYHRAWRSGKTDEDYHPVIDDGRTKDEIYQKIREFALNYSGSWSWFLEFGNNCHTFQTEAMSKLNLEKVKKI